MEHVYRRHERVVVREYVARKLVDLAGRVGTVTRVVGDPAGPHVPGPIVEIAFDGLGMRLGLRPSHIKPAS